MKTNFIDTFISFAMSFQHWIVMEALLNGRRYSNVTLKRCHLNVMNVEVMSFERYERWNDVIWMLWALKRCNLNVMSVETMSFECYERWSDVIWMLWMLNGCCLNVMNVETMLFECCECWNDVIQMLWMLNCRCLNPWTFKQMRKKRHVLPKILWENDKKILWEKQFFFIKFIECIRYTHFLITLSIWNQKTEVII